MTEQSTIENKPAVGEMPPDVVYKAMLGIANEVAQKVQIEDVCLVNTRAVRNVRPDSLPGDVHFDFECNHTLDRDEKRLAARVHYRFHARYDGEQNVGDPLENAPLCVYAIFRANYKLESLDGLSDAHIAAFATLNGAFNTWPYWREYLQSTLSRMGLPPITVPVFQPRKIAKLFEKARPVDVPAEPVAVKSQQALSGE
jgi:hypothetical protein